MEIYDLLKDTAEALARNTDIGDWCLATFGAALEVDIDEDVRDPSSAAPAVRLHSPYKRAHQEQRQVEHGFYMYVLLNSAADKLNADINLNEFAATEHLIRFLTMAIGVVFDTKPLGAVMEYSLETDTITSYPYFEADVALQFTQPLVIGQNPITV